MTESTTTTHPDQGEFALHGATGTLHAREWHSEQPRWIAVLVHGYGEHLGRYGHVAATLTDAGAAVFALDHVGHGRSSGERVLIEDFEPVVADVRLLVEEARRRHPDLPVVLIGHSMGGLIAARYAQLHRDSVCTVLSGPVLGRWRAVEQLLAAEVIPDDPIDTDTLSRDPAVGRDYTDDPLVWHGPFKRPTLLALQAALATIADGGRIDHTLWMHGSEDQLVPIEDTRAGWEQLRGEDCSEIIHAEARHEIFNEVNRDEVLADAVDWVQRHLPD